jgi:hypothetical protein
MSKIFRGQIGRQICEVREIGKFGRFERSGNFGGRKDRHDSLAGNEYIFVTSFRLCKLSFR